jgi:hypothetical protein
MGTHTGGAEGKGRFAIASVGGATGKWLDGVWPPPNHALTYDLGCMAELGAWRGGGTRVA